MDDLQTLATLLNAPEPSPLVAQRSLVRLQRRMRRRPRRTAWVLSATTAAAAAAAAVVVVTGTAGPTATPNGPPSAAVRLGGGQILLAAAVTAERTPEGSGAYWYVKVEAGSAYETWTGRKGGAWLRGEKTGGEVVELARPAPFRLGGVEVGFEQLRELPTEPEALKRWIADGVDRGDVRTSAGRLDAAGKARAVFSGLVSLVSELPAAPEVRGAAFRALAGYPGVESLGPVDGGEGLMIPGVDGVPVRLVVDPATSRVRDSNFFVTADGGEAFNVTKPVTITAEWTDTLPD
ncbi:CU044_5270 family protein [Nonomuraea sp. NPDC050556]|uniref:CU044_5270 family protein n=1 Tax=Nonomuraea sp. NPDC050556 TaxID=3364369 RepID=UPI0037908ADE